MKFFIVISTLVALTVAVEYYHTGNDYLDVDKQMSDPALVKTYLDCYLDRRPCNALAYTYKIIMHDSLIHGCDRCNAAQRHLWYRFLTDLQKYPEEYAAYKARYDPDGVLIPALMKVVASY